MKTEIQIIGEALFGKSWMTQIAENLKDQNGEYLARRNEWIRVCQAKKHYQANSYVNRRKRYRVAKQQASPG